MSPGPSLTTMCSNARGGEGEGASRPPCTTHASGQSTMYKASRLKLFSILYVRTYSGLCQAEQIAISHPNRALVYVHYNTDHT